MKKGRIIELQEGPDFIVCDNSSCDYTVPTEKKEYTIQELREYVNKPCPKCGENLLTEEDFKTTKFLIGY